MRQENWQVPRCSAGNRVVIWRPTRRLIGEATGPLDGRSHLESTREEITVSKCGPRSSRWCAESELLAAVKTAPEGLGIQSVAKDLRISCRLNLH